jgi:hypothetical protein
LHAASCARLRQRCAEVDAFLEQYVENKGSEPVQEEEDGDADDYLDLVGLAEDSLHHRRKIETALMRWQARVALEQ